MFIRLLAGVIGTIFWAANIAVCSTLRLKVINTEILNKVHGQGKQIIFASWHGQFFTGAFFTRRWKMCVLPITSLRGQIIASLARRYKYRVIPYPEFGTPGERMRAVQGILQAIKEGYDLALVVDGPPAPKFHKVNPGVLYFAQKTGSTLVPVGYYIDKKITMFWRWDKYEIPLPFARTVIALGEPLAVPADMEVVELQKMTKKLEEEIDKSCQVAEQAYRSG